MVNPEKFLGFLMGLGAYCIGVAGNAGLRVMCYGVGPATTALDCVKPRFSAVVFSIAPICTLMLDIVY